MKKIEIAPCVVVYKDVVKNVDKLYELVVKYQDKFHLYLNPSEESLEYLNDRYDAPMYNNSRNILSEWGNIGRKIEIPLSINSISDNVDGIEYIQDFYKSYEDIYKDYLADHLQCKNLPPFVERSILNRGGANKVLMRHYGSPIPDGYVENSYPNLMPWHVDTYDYTFDIDYAVPTSGVRNILSSNLYLNDNYAGGRIGFFYMKEPKSKVSYKPEAGDVVIYPSGWPVSHSVQKAYGPDRYLIFSALDLFYDGLTPEEITEFIPFNNKVFNEGSFEFEDDHNLKMIDGKDL